MLVVRTWKARKYASEKPSSNVTVHTIAQNLSVDQ